VRIGVIGDVHLAWDDRDVALLDGAGYDLLLFVGDLAGYGAEGAVRVSRSIAQLRTPSLVMPGNHDAVTTMQLGAEVLSASEAMRDMLSIGMASRVARLRKALGRVPLCGFSLHRFEPGLTILAARPHSIGGPRLAFRRYLARRFGVRTLADSAARLRGLFDEIAPTERVIVLAHCGPIGLGATRDAIYGNDFRPGAGDWGDPDLAAALAHATATGKSVLAVVAGHMHHKLRGGGDRTWHVEREGVQHVNAARVPRRRRNAGASERHHVRLTLEGAKVGVEQVWLTA
jgi:uncharacterized protein (TIGR04168 family)